MALANAAKSDSGNNVTETQKSETDKIENNNDKNVLAKLLKMADRKSGPFGLERGQSRTNEQKDEDNVSGKNIDFII